MSTPLTTTFMQDVLWWSNPPILFTCAFLLFRRPEFRGFRGFFAYLLFVGTKQYAMMLVLRYWGTSSYTSFYISVAGNLVSIGLSFFVLYEVVQNVLTSGTVKISKQTFLLLTATLLLIAVLLSTRFQAENDQVIMLANFLLQNVLRVAEVGLLLILATLTIFFGLYWGDLAFGVAAGFGVYAAMELVRLYFRASSGPTAHHDSNLIAQWSYQTASFIWLFYLIKRPRKPGPPAPLDRLSEYKEPLEKLMK